MVLLVLLVLLVLCGAYLALCRASRVWLARLTLVVVTAASWFSAVAVYALARNGAVFGEEMTLVARIAMASFLVSPFLLWTVGFMIQRSVTPRTVEHV